MRGGHYGRESGVNSAKSCILGVSWGLLSGLKKVAHSLKRMAFGLTVGVRSMLKNSLTPIKSSFSQSDINSEEDI
jgi:hypothetical protein